MKQNQGRNGALTSIIPMLRSLCVVMFICQLNNSQGLSQKLLFHEDFEFEDVESVIASDVPNVPPDSSQSNIFNEKTASIENKDVPEKKKELTELEKKAFHLHAKGKEMPDGFRMSGVDDQGKIVIIEDHVAGNVIVRLQKIHSSVLNVQLYAKNGTLAFKKSRKISLVGTQIAIPTEKIPLGYSTLVISIDAAKFKKKLFRQGEVVTLP